MTSQLQQFVARIERLEEERKTLAADIKEVYAEAKGAGFDVKILRKVIAKRKKSAADIQEEEAMIDVYMAGLGANVGDVQTFTRKDGVKVTLERVDEAARREAVKREAVRIDQEEVVALSKQALDLGLVSADSVIETVALAQAINDKWGDGKTIVNPITGEITEHNSGAVAASSAPDAAGGLLSQDTPAANHSGDGYSPIADTADGEGATSPSANPSAYVIAIQPEQPQAATVVAGKVTSAVQESEGVFPDAITDAVEDSPDLTSTADPYDELAIPDFLRRSPPPSPPIEKVLP